MLVVYLVALPTLTIAAVLLMSFLAVPGQELLHYLSMARSDLITMGAAIAGAGIAGLLAWVQARQTGKQTLARDEQARMEAHKATALGVLLKVQLITNGYFTHQKSMWDQLSNANDNGHLHDPMWRKIKQQVGSSLSTPTFNTDEFIPLMIARRADLINECQLMSLRYQVTEASILKYNEKRDYIQDILLGLENRLEGGIVYTVVPDDLKPKLDILSAEIEGLIRQIYVGILTDFKTASLLCTELTRVFRAQFKGVFVTLDPIDFNEP